MKADTAPLLSSVEVVDGEADLEELTASSEAAVATGATLAARQADALEAASQELLCSPDITKYASDQLFRCHALALHLPLRLWPLSCATLWRPASLFVLSAERQDCSVGGRGPTSRSWREC